MIQNRFGLIGVLAALIALGLTASSPVAAQTYPPGLVSYWSFNESSGYALEPVGGNSGVLNGVIRVPGIIGSGAVFFDNAFGASVAVGPGVGNNFSTTTGIAIEALIKPLWSGEPGEYDEIFRKEDGDARVLLSFQNDGFGPGQVLSFGANVGGAYSELDMPLDGFSGRPTLANLENGLAHHIVATYDRATGIKAIWIDGIVRFSVNLTPGSLIANGGDAGAAIGNLSTSGNEAFNGVIDEVAYYNRALTASEVAAHYANVQQGRNYFTSPYAWSGVLQPVNADGSSIFKLGSTVPIKFKLTGASAGITNLVARLYVAKISSNVVGWEPEPESSNPASTGNTFRYDATTGEYICNLGTKGTTWTVGTYQLRIDLGDGDTTRSVNISLR